MNDKFTSLYFISGNRSKYEVYDSILDTIDLKWSEIEIEETQSLLYDVIIEGKIQKARSKLPNLPFFVEHSGINIRKWNSLPGGLTGTFMKCVGNDGICKMMQSYELPEEREAVATAVLGYCSPDGTFEIFRSDLPGTISASPRGEDGFGWDAIFIPDGHDKTYAEMAEEEREQVSVRRIVANKLFNTVIRQHFEMTGIPHALSDGAGSMNDREYDLARFRQLIAEHFSTDELHTLVFDLGINYESLKGEALDGKARELVAYCSRTLHLTDLLEACQHERPNVEWQVFKTRG